MLNMGAQAAFATTCQLCAPTLPSSAMATSQPLRPLTISVEASLDFSRVARIGSQGGSVNVDPMTGARRVSGALRDLGGGELKGQVHVQGEPLRPIRVILPTRVTLTASDGSSAEVDHLATNLNASPALGIDGSLDFSFGGQLNVSQANAGDYHGRIPITVEYQ